MKRKLALLVSLVSVISVATVLGYGYFSDEGPFSTNNEAQYSSYDYTEGATVSPGEFRDAVFNDITGDYRPIYSGMSEEQYGYFFSELPQFEDNFFDISELVYDGKITDYSRLSSSYWLQPEFYPGWFSSVNDSYTDNDVTMWTPEGYGCYPAIKEITTIKGTKIEVNTYFRTGYATESYQGLVLKPYLPDSAVSLRGNILFEQTEAEKKYFKVSIGNSDNVIFESFKSSLMVSNVGPEDWFVILKPTYRLISDKYNVVIREEGFPTDWVRIIKLNIDIASDTPTGDYVAAINIVPPSFEINQEFYFSIEHEYYGALYYPSGGFHRSNIPHFQVIIHVT